MSSPGVEAVNERRRNRTLLLVAVVVLVAVVFFGVGRSKVGPSCQRMDQMMFHGGGCR